LERTVKELSDHMDLLLSNGDVRDVNQKKLCEAMKKLLANSNTYNKALIEAKGRISELQNAD
jgi:rRNA pseudouridine-1189 N-methylase Emg1 (Nep1/Mra1 family)